MTRILFVFLVGSFASYGQDTLSKPPMFRASNACAYISHKGDTIIPHGRYLACYTDTFATHALVKHHKHGIVAIDRKENILYEVFAHDGHPDKPSDGLYRIKKGNMIGYANLEGKVVIIPQYTCAMPFRNGTARVAKQCESFDAHSKNMVEGEWFTINRQGLVVETTPLK